MPNCNPIIPGVRGDTATRQSLAIAAYNLPLNDDFITFDTQLVKEGDAITAPLPTTNIYLQPNLTYFVTINLDIESIGNLSSPSHIMEVYVNNTVYLTFEEFTFTNDVFFVAHFILPADTIPANLQVYFRSGVTTDTFEILEANLSIFAINN